MTKRLLTADEIECRIQQTDNTKYATYLLYKDARTDKKILDEKYGDLWMNSFQLINGKLFCTISVFNTQINQWISRSDVGVESNVEKEKGEASDAFKRAGFKWGIGTELYSAPNIKVQLTPDDIYNNRCCLKLKVSEIGYDDSNRINRLVLTDSRNRVRYTYPHQAQQQPNTSQNTQQIQPQQPPVQQVQYSPKALIDNMLLNVEVIKMQPGVNTGQLQAFVNHYTKKLSTGGWTGDFDTLKLWNMWIQRANSPKN